MSWDGAERRTHECHYEDKIMEIREDVIEVKGDVKHLNARINGALDKITSHIEEGEFWRGLVAKIGITLIIAVIGWIFTAGAITFHLGKVIKQVEINTIVITKLAENGKLQTA